jgi:glycosyltransferase involved in cell wall biosynthesis
MTLTVWRVFVAAFKSKADLIHIHDPELIPVGLVLKLIGRKVIYDAHEDLVTQVRAKYWLPRVVRGGAALLARFLSRLTNSFFDGIVAATPFIAQRYDAHKTTVVQNFPDLTEFSETNHKPYKERNDRILYVGGVSVVRGAKEMVASMTKLTSQAGTLVIAGQFIPEELQVSLASSEGWTRVDFKGWLTREQVTDELGSAKVGLVVLHPISNYLDSYPIKMFEYMAAGLPVIASDFPLWREIVEEADCGLLVNPASTEDIAKAIDRLLMNPEEAHIMGLNGQRAVQEKYNWQLEEQKLVALYDKLLHFS